MYGTPFEREVRPRPDGTTELGLVGFALPKVILPSAYNEEDFRLAEEKLNDHLARHAVVHYEARAIDLRIPKEEL